MTDKERILAEIKTLQLSTMDEHMNFYSQEAQGEYNSLTKLEAFINSVKEEPVSGGLEEAAYHNCIDRLSKESIEDFKAGAKWQMAQMMKDATDVTVHIDAGGYPYIPQMELYDYDKDMPLAKEGDRYKVVLIKEE